MARLAPSILSADFSGLANQVRAVEEAGAHVLHLDIMDGHFVPNITFGPVVVEAVKKCTRLPLDVHLMIDNPEKYIDAFVNAGASWITFHAEATAHAHRLSERIRAQGVRAGIAINPGTSVSTLEAIIENIDYVLIMSVNPGFGGQKFIPETLPKLARLRELIMQENPKVEIQIDGGITAANARPVIDAGAECLVAGSAVFGHDDIGAAVRAFLDIF